MEASLARHVRAVMVARCVGRTCTLLASYLKYDRQLNGLTLSSFEDTAKVSGARFAVQILVSRPALAILSQSIDDVAVYYETMALLSFLWPFLTRSSC